MKQLFEKRYFKEGVRAFFDGVDGIYLVADESWFESKEFDEFMSDIMKTQYSVMWSPFEPIEMQLDSMQYHNCEEVIL